MRIEERTLAVGGVHALEGTEPCRLTRVESASALEDLHWKDALVVRAQGEGRAELALGLRFRGGTLEHGAASCDIFRLFRPIVVWHTTRSAVPDEGGTCQR